VSPELITVIGFTAAALTTGAWLPQVIKTWKSRSAEDFSWAYLAMFAGGVGLWAVYGYWRHDPAVLAANVITVLLVLSVGAVKLSRK
jgi:MtN3 and saliva related transmembrane protein